ncbi:MAG: tetratricopeptide repeat protein, partial [Holophagales bacterium]|nr:tetratricopeptide repeat protein [Holophagales bacterium]
HPHHATSFWGLANIHRDRGSFDSAEELYRRALEIRRQALPLTHPELRSSIEEYAVLLRRTGRQAEAEALEAELASP